MAPNVINLKLSLQSKESSVLTVLYISYQFVLKLWFSLTVSINSKLWISQPDFPFQTTIIFITANLYNIFCPLYKMKQCTLKITCSHVSVLWTNELDFKALKLQYLIIYSVHNSAAQMNCSPQFCMPSYEPPHDKTNKMTVRPAKTQISLGICPVWSEPSLCAQWVAKDPSFLHADSEDSDQTGQMPSLICVFAECTCHFVGFVMRRLINK